MTPDIHTIQEYITKHGAVNTFYWLSGEKGWSHREADRVISQILGNEHWKK